MDNERAKFILQSFRPDGADAHDPDFAEALALAAEDRELGEWLTKERARDAAFAAALGEVPIPEDLRTTIFEMMEDGDPELTDLDASFVGALASVRAPEGLRDQILSAMEVERTVVRPSVSRWKNWRWASSAVAAVLVFAFVGLITFSGGNAVAGTNVAEVELAAIEMLSSPLFSLDLKDDRQAEIYDWLKGQELPAPEVLPAGLQGVPGIGCKYLEIGDKKSRGSMICYQMGNDKVVHLVMLKKKELGEGEKLPSLNEAEGHCAGCESSGWATTSWSDEEHVFIMLSKMKPEQLASVFSR
ncbi:MAG: hypothetical protein ACSHYF_14090 [Verrucomicrobiaceae bacterium]